MVSNADINILYIEDDPLLCDLFKIAMEPFGYVVDIANNGKDGLALCHEKSYDIVAIDFLLPDMNGIDIARCLLYDEPDLPLLMVTGKGSEKIATEALTLGVSDYVVKEDERVYLEKIPNIIKRLLVQSRLAREKQEVKKNHDRLLSAVEKSSDGIILFDADDKFIYANQKYKDLYPSEIPDLAPDKVFRDIVKRSADNGNITDAVGREEQWINERVAQHQSLANVEEQQTANGKWIRINEFRTDDGGIFGVYTDISELKKIQTELVLQQQALEESNQRFRDFAESSSDWFWECDENLRFSYFSEGYEKITNLKKQDIIGQTREEMANPQPDEFIAFQNHLNDLKNHLPFQNFQYTTVGPEGEQLTFRVSGKPVFFGGTFSGYRGTGSNVTKYARMGEELKTRMQEAEESRLQMQAQAVQMTELAEQQTTLKDKAEAADQSKSEFLATMSHEIRTPMTGVLGMADLVLDSKLSARQRKYIETIKDSGEALLTILNDILDFSKLEAEKLSIENIDFHLPSLLEEIVSLLGQRASEKGIDLSFEIDGDVPHGINSDPGRVRQMLFNLVGNAIKFTDVGKVEIFVSQILQGNDQFLLTFAIKDTGIGISEQAQARLFGKFEQADASTSRTYGGTGLGLAICKMLSELMGGEVGVKSRLGEGSTFYFSILSRVASEEVRSKSTFLRASDFIAKRKLKLLLAEDNQVNQMFISTLLETLGHSVDIAPNGLVALEMVQKGTYDLLLSDVRMPVMDGMVLAASIRELEGRISKIPIIGVTADAMTDHQKKYIAAGMDEVSMKPIDLSDLLWKIDNVLGEDVHVRDSTKKDAPEEATSTPEDAGSEEASAEIEDFLKQLQSVADKYDEAKSNDDEDQRIMDQGGKA